MQCVYYIVIFHLAVNNSMLSILCSNHNLLSEKSVLQVLLMSVYLPATTLQLKLLQNVLCSP